MPWYIELPTLVVLLIIGLAIHIAALISEAELLAERQNRDSPDFL